MIVLVLGLVVYLDGLDDRSFSQKNKIEASNLSLDLEMGFQIYFGVNGSSSSQTLFNEGNRPCDQQHLDYLPA